MLLGGGGVAWVSCLLANVYIVGLNQITDVAIDRINKPYLPLASGALTRSQAQGIVIFCLVTALVISFTQNNYLFLTVLISILIGTAYSLPPMRLKRFPLWASVCILTVRGLVVNLGIFLYFASVLQIDPLPWERISALTGFMLIFSIVIALFKDIPDTLGDAQNNIQTLSLQWGRGPVFTLCVAILIANYLVIMVWSSFETLLIPKLSLLVVHGILLISLLLKYRETDPQDPKQFPNFYQFIWKLFYLEYLLFPVACLAGLLG